MSVPPDPPDPAAGSPQVSETAQLARERLRREIERVREGVEELLDEQAGGVGDEESLRSELERLRIETRGYVKSKVRKAEKRLASSVREIDIRTELLEQQLEQVEAERERSEWRIYT